MYHSKKTLKCKSCLKRKAIRKPPLVSTVILQTGKVFPSNELRVGIYLGTEAAVPFPEDHSGWWAGRAAALPRAAVFSIHQPTGLLSLRRTVKCPF